MFFEFISILFFILSVFFTIWLRFPQFKIYKKIKKNSNHSSLSTLFISLASHIGTGNIIGVMSGIFLAGPGVIFWMWIYAFFSMSFSLIENSYAVKFHKKDDCNFYGGTILTIKNGLNKPFLAFIFGICLFITNAFLFPPLQINAIVESINYVFNIPIIIIVIILIGFFIFYIYRGNNRITKFIDLIVPIMSVTYTVVIIFLIGINYKSLPFAIYKIIISAFNFKSFSISTLIYVMSIGIRRSMFSNEAGLGTTPSFSGSNNNSDVTVQGYYQMLGVIVDTLILCTLTGILLIQLNQNYSISVTSIIDILEFYLPNFGKFLGLFLLLSFALSSVIGEFVMAENNIILISKNKLFSKFLLRFVFTFTLILGSFFSLDKAFSLIDYGLIILGLINLYVLFKLEYKYHLFTKKKVFK